MAIVMLDDGTAQIEVSVFNELFEAERAKIKEDEVLVIEGKVQRDDFSGGLRVTADKLLTLSQARDRFARALKLSLNGEVEQASGGSAAAQRLRTMLAPFRDGPCPVRVRYRNHTAECELPLGDAWRVRLDDQLLSGLRDWLTPGNVEVVYS
jgi:DNA polymerase-3 subunit alpha